MKKVPTSKKINNNKAKALKQIATPLNAEEQNVMNMITAAYTAFTKLPPAFPNELMSMAKPLDDMQKMLLMRPLMRQYPDYFGMKSKQEAPKKANLKKS